MAIRFNLKWPNNSGDNKKESDLVVPESKPLNIELESDNKNEIGENFYAN